MGHLPTAEPEYPVDQEQLSELPVLNRGFVVSDNQAYALYFSSGEAQWGDSQGILAVAADTFTPAAAGSGDSGDEDD